MKTRIENGLFSVNATTMGTVTYAGAEWRQRLLMAVLLLAVGSQARTSMSQLMQAHPERFGVKDSDQVNRVMGYADLDHDGFPDTNTSSTCYRNGEAIATVVAVPSYYLGMLTYYLLTPVISVKEQLRQVLSGAFRITASPFHTVYLVLGYIRYPFDWVFTCLPCSLSVIIKALIGIMGPAAFETFCCLFLIRKLTTYHVTGHKSLVAALIVVAPVFAGYVYVNSSGPGYETLGPLQPLTSILFCPFQLASGMSDAVSGSMEYWVACMDIICLAIVLLLMALLLVRPKARKSKGNAVQPTVKVGKRN